MQTETTQAVLDALRRDSRLRHDPEAAVSYLMDLLYYGEFNIFEQVSSVGAFEQVNLVGVKGRQTASPLWLVSYVSTGTDPIPAAWKRTGGNGLEPRIDDERGMLYGLGSCSGKVDFVLKTMAAARFRREDLARAVHVVAVFGEESQGAGLHALLDNQLPRPGAALLGAPTNLELWTEHPGCVTIQLEIDRRIRHRRMPPFRGVWELEVPGRSAHAQWAGLGDDALASGQEVVRRLRKAGEVRILVFDAGESANRVAGRCLIKVATSYDVLPDLPQGVVARPVDDGTSLPFPVDELYKAWFKARDAGEKAAREHTHVARNRTVARPVRAVHTGWMATGRDQAVGTVTFWTGPGADTHAIVETFASAAQHALTGKQELEIQLRVVQDRAALCSPSDEDGFLDVARGALRDLSVPPACVGGRLTTDAGLLAREGATPIVFGPGRTGGDLYRDDEGVPLRHIEVALAFYERVIRSWCVQPPIPSLTSGRQGSVRE